MKKLIYEIKLESNKLSQKTDEELNQVIQQVKKEFNINKSKNLKIYPENIIIKWFGLVQEISFRKIGLKHFDTQLLAGLFLHQGNIVEMKTGEGKTLVSTLPVALNALSGKGVHVVTVNEYLAERDQKWMGKIYEGLGLSVGLVKSTSTTFEKQKSYQSDITYITNSELVFDYLRDNSAYNVNELVQRPFNFCLIDEIDSVLIDEARTPLILSNSKKNENKKKLYLAKAYADTLEKELDFQLDEKRKDINLTEKGYKKLLEKLGKKTLYDPKDAWILEILNALKAKYFFKLNKDYIILKNKIVIVDEFTGRIMEDRRWSMGLHEAIEMKEKVQIGGGTKTKSSITYQTFFPLYPKLAGMTGTAKTTEQEFQEIYNLKVIVLPTVKPLIRKDLPDLVYQTELAKWKAVLNESKNCFEKGQPVLIGTASIEKSEFLADLFKFSKIPHQVLNAKPENLARENEIIAQAGKKYAVTIATNMAGRGTDIILGGNPIFEVKEQILKLIMDSLTVNNVTNHFIKKELEGLITKEEENLIINWVTNIKKDYNYNQKLPKNLINDIQNLPYSLDRCQEKLKILYDFLSPKFKQIWEKENTEIKNLGGLFVLGTERHETRRIDNQLRGRAGRQGDPGISQFFVSLEDELIQIFGGNSIGKWVEFLIQDKDVPLESDFLTKSLENAQKKVELYNYDLRKNVFQYDEVLSLQREKIFEARKEIIFKNISPDFFFRLTEISFDEIYFENSLNSLENEFEALAGPYSFASQKNNLNLKESTQKLRAYQEIWISYDLRFASGDLYQIGLLKNTKAFILLKILDFFWTEHIERMGYIRETINWRAYGQQNPLVEYNLEAFDSFKTMFAEIKSSMIYYYLNRPINY
jgi:preprotein translocase subunit SecA